MPFRGGTDLEGTLSDFQFALNGLSVKAVETTISHLRAGMIEEASKEYSPKAPKLAEFVRAEQRRLDAFNRPKVISYQPVGHEFKDWRIIHRQKACNAAARGFTCIEGVMIEEWHSGMVRRKWRAGTEWFWSISEVWIPAS